MLRMITKYPGNHQQGQALMVAVLLMMVILLTGILFVAIVSYNQAQSARSSDVVAAQSLAEAGIRWCNENLNHSPEGADWRPPFRPLILDTSDPRCFDYTNPDTWPVPPVQDTNGVDYGCYGADLTLNAGNPTGAADTADDYYSEFERSHGWHGLVDPSARYRRLGFFRIPDINSKPAAVTLPTEVGALGGKGHILVRVTYDPDPPYEPEDGTAPTPDPMSKYIKIEAVGVVDQDVPVFRYLVAYKPIGLTDYTLFVTDKDQTGRPAKIGFSPSIDMLNNGGAETLFQSFYGPLKFNTQLQLVGGNVNSPSDAAGASTRFVLTDGPTNVPATPEVPGVNPRIMGGGYLRSDTAEAQGIVEAGTAPTTAVYTRDATGTLSAATALAPTGPAFDTVQGKVMDGETAIDSNGFSRATRRLTPPEAATGQGLQRYLDLTRDSGSVVTDTATGQAVNLGRIGQGLGVYVDNASEVQFVDKDGSHNLDALIGDWMRLPHSGQYPDSDSGWNPLQTLYTPPGVEVTVFPTYDATLDFGRLSPQAQPMADSSRANPQPNEIWWPNYNPARQEPGLRLTRHDRNWQYWDATNNRIVDSGEKTMYVYYPGYEPGVAVPPPYAERHANQVLYSQGNLRIHGTLPPRASGNGRDYNLTIVSGGTIYIDGQLLSPQDALGRDDGDPATTDPAGAIPDEQNTHVALLARDCVCLNASRIVPQAVSGDVAAAPDDPMNPRSADQHYVLSPETSGSAYSNFVLGEPVNLGNTQVNLTAIHAAMDPGPAALGLSVYDTNMGTGVASWRTHNFGGLNPTKFFLAQTGILAPAPNVDTALTPNWSQPSYAPSVNPTVPWNLNPDLSNGEPAVLKSVAISPADPNISTIGMGSTEYWLKKWKVYETDAAGNPRGSIHAKVNAVIYAENGCWFVIPGNYFDNRQSGDMARRFRRYNYDICVRGAISECFHAEPEMVRDWSDKWAWPYLTAGGAWAWNTIRYEYDESLRVPRDQPTTTVSGNLRSSNAAAGIVPWTNQANLPLLPVLPVSKDLIFYGEGS
ncbi:hypothetical protein LLH03_19295 [bacterium]|nr:hypothetical protein [bacterium]